MRPTDGGSGGSSKPFHCDECGQESTTRAYLGLHLSQRHGLCFRPCLPKRRPVCDACPSPGRWFSSLAALAQHWVGDHLPSGPRATGPRSQDRVCDDCGRRLSRGLLHGHWQRAHTTRPHQPAQVRREAALCDLCPFRSVKGQLASHLIKHGFDVPAKNKGRGPEERLGCDDCGVSVGRRGFFRHWLRAHGGASVAGLRQAMRQRLKAKNRALCKRCDQCGQLLERFDLPAHLRRVHGFAL